MSNYNDYKNYNDHSPTGGYKNLGIYRQAEIIHDFTVEFTKLYIVNDRRTIDQMNHAARSGKQNIAEGYMQKSIESRIKLVGVARGSLEELLVDYHDFLRQKGYGLWRKDSSEAKAVRKMVYNRYNGYNNYKIYLQNPEQAANVMICLINQTNQMLDQKLRWMEEKFIQEGGFRESLFKKRISYRNKIRP